MPQMSPLGWGWMVIFVFLGYLMFFVFFYYNFVVGFLMGLVEFKEKELVWLW